MAKKSKKNKKKTPSTSATLKLLKSNRSSKKQVIKLIKVAMDMHQSANYSGAERAYKEILELQPGHADALYFLGNIYFDRKELDKAEQYTRQAIESNNKVDDYHMDLGNILREKNDNPGALESYQRAIQLNPYYAEAFYNMGYVCNQMKRLEEACEFFMQSAKLKPELLRNQTDLGMVLLTLNRPKEAEAAFKQAISVNQTDADLHDYLAQSLIRQHKSEDAIATFRASLNLSPENPNTHYHLGYTQLLTGDFENGWKEFEWRLRSKLSQDKRIYFKSKWEGADLSGKKLLLACESDDIGQILFNLRMLPAIKEKNATIIIECPETIKTLLENVPHIDEIANYVKTGTPKITHDTYIHYNSIANILPPATGDFSAYIETSPEKIQTWQPRFEKAGQHIAIVFNSQVNSYLDAAQDCIFEPFKAILNNDQQHYYTFASDIDLSQTNLAIQNLDSEINDLADSAAIIANLDLVVTNNETIAQLAGAMNKPVWLILPHTPSWIWMLDSKQSQWYPSVELFRQQDENDWQGVGKIVCDKMEAYLAKVG